MMPLLLLIDAADIFDTPLLMPLIFSRHAAARFC